MTTPLAQSVAIELIERAIRDVAKPGGSVIIADWAFYAGLSLDEVQPRFRRINKLEKQLGIKLFIENARAGSPIARAVDPPGDG